MYHSFLVILDELNHLVTCVVLSVWFSKLSEVDAVWISDIVIVVAVLTTRQEATTVAPAATSKASTAAAAFRKLHKGHDRASWSLIMLSSLGMVLLVASSYHLDTTDCITHRIVDEHLVFCLLISDSSLVWLFLSTSDQDLRAIQRTEDRLKAGWKGLFSCAADHLPSLVYLCKVQSLDSNHVLPILIQATDDIYAGALDTATVLPSGHVQGRHLRPFPLPFQVKAETATCCPLLFFDQPTNQIDMHILVAAKTYLKSRKAFDSWIFLQTELTAIL